MLNSLNSLAEFKDPFNKNCIESLMFFCYSPTAFSPARFSAKVKFKNGDTEGEQSLKADSFPALVKKVENFIESVDN